MVWEIQGSKVGYMKTEIMHSVIHDLAKFQVLKTAADSKFEPWFDLLTS